MSKDSWLVFILFILCFTVNLFCLYNNIQDLSVPTWVLFGFWLGSYRD